MKSLHNFLVNNRVQQTADDELFKNDLSNIEEGHYYKYKSTSDITDTIWIDKCKNEDTNLNRLNNIFAVSLRNNPYSEGAESTVYFNSFEYTRSVGTAVEFNDEDKEIINTVEEWMQEHPNAHVERVKIMKFHGKYKIVG